jgi:hypothetical protein
MSDLTKLSDQIALHEEWRTELASTRRGSSTLVERVQRSHRPSRSPGQDLTLSSVRGYESSVLKVKKGEFRIKPSAP